MKIFKSLQRLIATIVLFGFLFTFTVTPAFAAITYSYDAAGNMTTDGHDCYTYNQANQLTKVTKCSTGQLVAEYVYDYQGNRIKKKEYAAGALKKTVYSLGDEYEMVKLASSGATQNTTYYKVNDEFVARKNPDGGKTYYVNDHLGSTSVLTDLNGNLVEKTTYEPYGEIKSGGVVSKFQYTGQEKDAETHLNYYNFRYYDPHIGRFTQADDIIQNVYDPQFLNRYSYVRNNPLRYTDPNGHFAVLLAIAAGAAFTASVETYTQIQVHAILTNQSFFQAAFDANFDLDEERVLNSGALGAAGVVLGTEAAIVAAAGAGGVILQSGLSTNNASLTTLGSNVYSGSLNIGASKTNLPYSKSRPSYGKGQVEQVWENAKQPNGNVYDPKTGKQIVWDQSKPRQGQWDMGHVPDQQYKDLLKKYQSGKINLMQFMNETRNPANYRPELPSSNRSNK